MTKLLQQPWIKRLLHGPQVEDLPSSWSSAPCPAVIVSRDGELVHTLVEALTGVAQPLRTCRNVWVVRHVAEQIAARLVLVDWRLPERALTQLLRHLELPLSEALGRPLIVAVVPADDDDLTEAAIANGVDDWLSMVSSARALTARLKQLAARTLASDGGGPSSRPLTVHPAGNPSALDRIDDGLFSWDLVLDCFEPTESWATMIGADEELPNDAETWLGRVHPEDRPRLEDAIRACGSERSAPLLHRYRIRHVLGDYRWMLVRADVIRSPQGEPIRLVGRQIELGSTDDSHAEGSLYALYDPLTRLPNRALLMDRLRHAMATVRRNPSRPFAVLFFDVDRFKNVNDSLGHLKGDSLLRSVAERVASACRPTDTVARFGGDEFAVVVEDVPDVRAAIVAAERLQAQFRKPFDLDGIEVFASISIGIAFWRDDYQQPEELLRDADTAMYRAKAQGRNTFAVFDEEMHAHVVSTLTLENDLRRALTRNEFRAYFQPVLSLRHGHITGFEVLARWEHPERGLLLPKDFIPVAEEMGTIIQIDRVIAEQACTWLRTWQSKFRFAPPLTVSVNISTTQFLQSDLVPQIDHILRKTGLYGQSLKIEVTESVLMENARYATDMLTQLRALDIGIMIDDFGTGYSSLAYLRRFEVDTLKIDYSFVSRMTENEESEEIVRTIVTLARNLGKETVAEGVETRTQLDMLRELKVDRVQGFYVSPALAPVDAEALLESLRSAPDHLERILTSRLRAQRKEAEQPPPPDPPGPLQTSHTPG